MKFFHNFQTSINPYLNSSTFREVSWLALARVIQGVTSLIASLAIARYLGPQDFGILSLAITVSAFVSTLATLGLEQIATREFALHGADQNSLNLIRRLRYSGAIIGVLILVVISNATAIQQLGISHLLLVLCLLPMTQIGDVAEWRLIAAKRSRKVAIVIIITSPLAAMVRFVFIAIDGNLSDFAWLLLAEHSIKTLLFAMPGMRTPILLDKVKSKSTVTANSILSDSMPLLLSSIAVLIYMRIDQFMIAAMLGQKHVGLYSAVVTLAELPLILPALILRAILPALSQQTSSKSDSRDKILLTIMGVTFYFHLVISLLLAIFSKQIIVLVYGISYQSAAEAFRIQVLASPLVSLGILSTAWLVLERKTIHALRRTIAGAILNILLNIYLIPRYGIAGAAFATLIAQFMATYLSDAFYAQTRSLFQLKTKAMWPGNWQRHLK